MFAKRVDKVAPFRVMAVLERAKQLQSEGRDILHMEVGEPDFPTIQPIIDAGIDSLARQQTGYTQALGLPELRRAIAAYYQERYGVTLSENRVVVTSGASAALMLMSALLVDPGKGLLMADPGYPCNSQFLRIVEGQAHKVAVGADRGFQINGELINQHWRDNTIGVLAASPANPTGEILSLAALQDISAAVKAKNGVLVVDEIYQGLSYGEDCHSILEVDDDAYVINSFSKYFGMTGWRIGWMVVPEKAVAGLERLVQNLYIYTSVTAQYGALAALDPNNRPMLEARRKEFGVRREVLLNGLKALGFRVEYTPKGAYYIYANIEHFLQRGGWADSEAFCFDVLEKYGVALTPGTDFDEHSGAHHVRFAYTQPVEKLKDALARLKVAVGTL